MKNIPAHKLLIPFAATAALAIALSSCRRDEVVTDDVSPDTNTATGVTPAEPTEPLEPQAIPPSRPAPEPQAPPATPAPDTTPQTFDDETQ